VLRQLRSIRRRVSVPTISLVTSPILTGLDYCNSVQFEFSDVLVSRLQEVQNAAIHVVFNLCRTVHVTDALICLHWIKLPERIRLKVAVLIFISLAARDIAVYRQTFTQT
jgi:hypothetical protein